MAKKKTATPGPWAVRKHWADSEKYEVYPVRDGEPSVGQWGEIAEVGAGADNESARKNAILIAAAPELLEALHWLMASRYVPDSEAGIEAVTMARAAIQKATGENA